MAGLALSGRRSHPALHRRFAIYSRWGLIEVTSAEDVMQQLQSSQAFEAAHSNFFGSGTWGRYTFFNPVGPIAVMGQSSKDQPAALEKLYQLRWLDERVNTVIRAATPSLENNQSQGPASSVEGYFDQIRDALERISKLQSQLSRDRPQLRFLSREVHVRFCERPVWNPAGLLNRRGDFGRKQARNDPVLVGGPHSSPAVQKRTAGALFSCETQPPGQ
jgi:hypothetical protein